MNYKAYLQLMRFDKPIGILLLWLPTAWSLWIANKGVPPLRLFILFLSGTMLMRAAGCVINDIADRNIDRHVVRTQLRPLTSGVITLTQAFIILSILLIASLFILIQLPKECYYIALFALLVTFIYPFCKRFIDAPQLMLGIAFSMGIPMAYIASGVSLNWEFSLLFLINFAWIIVYDTIYAMVDKADDLRIGVRSTAIFFASYDRIIIGILQCILHGLWLYWGMMSATNDWFYFYWVLSGIILIYQQKLINKREPHNCFKAFRISIYYGALMWLAVSISI